jgi:hypothetical protein
MKQYFQLQFKILNRKITDFGFPLLLGYILILLVFILLSKYLFKNTEFAIYAYGLIALSFVSKLNEPKRNDFLKSVFSIILNLFAIIFTLFNFSTNVNATIPTPFSKKPFEFTIGFRRTFYIFPIAYFLTYISVTVGNFNLGVFSILLIGITCFSYYSKIENEYFVWNYNLSSKEFLIEKTKTCLIYFSLSCLPIIITLAVYFLNEIDILILFFLVCCTYLTTIIFAKYSSFPNEMNMSHVILITTSFLFPPILLIFIPLFYSQSIKKLNIVLND